VPWWVEWRMFWESIKIVGCSLWRK
jgi:hypothetical protein